MCICCLAFLKPQLEEWETPISSLCGGNLDVYAKRRRQTHSQRVDICCFCCTERAQGHGPLSPGTGNRQRVVGGRERTWADSARRNGRNGRNGRLGKERRDGWKWVHNSCQLFIQAHPDSIKKIKKNCAICYPGSSVLIAWEARLHW